MTENESKPRLEFKQSSIHGIGGFAPGPIRAGTLLIEYVGQIITKAESLHRCEAGNTSIFELDDDRDIDGAASWNPVRFLNHSCAPNCDAELIDGQIWIVARRDLAAAEEITFNYGYYWEDYREHPCRCGAPGCLGYIVSEEFFPALREGQGLEFRRV